MLVSFLMPTRRRNDLVKKSIQSLIDHWSSNQYNFEVLLRYDNDDQESYNEICQYIQDNQLESQVKASIGERYHYKGLHHYINELCEQASGYWLWLWNDDVIMETQDWDVILNKYHGKFNLLNPNSNHGMIVFPIVPKRWVDITGHFSLSRHNDTWVEHIAYELEIIKNIKIYVTHDRFDLTGNNNDEVFQDAKAQYAAQEFYDMKPQRDIDKRKLQQYLNILQRSGQN